MNFNNDGTTENAKGTIYFAVNRTHLTYDMNMNITENLATTYFD